MIFIPPTEKREGEFLQPKLPFSAVAGASFKQGLHDTFFNQVYERRMEELYEEGNVLTPDQANERYSLPGLEFNENIYEGVARLKHKRKQEEIARMTTMQLGSNGFWSLRGLGSLGASIIGNNLSPVDFAFNFVPIAGMTRYGRAANIVSKAAARGRIGGGLGKAVVKSQMPWFHRMVSAGIDASIGNLVLEVPLYYGNQSDQTRHTLGDVLLNTGLGGVFGGGLSGLGSILRAASRKWSLASQTSRVAAVRGAMNDFLADQPPRSADQILDIDTNVARARTTAALEVAHAEVDAKLGSLEAEIRARVEVQGKLGDANKADIEAIAVEAIKRSKSNKAQQGILSRLLERSQSGDGDATANLGRMFHLEFSPQAKTVPAPFSGGRLDAKLSPKQLQALEDVAYALPPETRRQLAQANSERFNVESYIAREVEAGRQQMMRRSYKQALEDMKAGRIVDPAKRVAAELDDKLKAERPASRPVAPGDEARARAQEEANLRSDIEELEKAVNVEGRESLKSATQPVDESGIRAGAECLIKSGI